LKIVRTIIVFDAGNVAQSEGWITTYNQYSSVILDMVNPPGTSRFLIRAKTRKLNDDGSPSTQWNRNGVAAIKRMFFDGMRKREWKAEQPVSLEKYLHGYSLEHPLQLYPGLVPLDEPLHASVGDFDFGYETHSRFRAAVEWETGNISSSHRSLNKMCLALMAGLVQAAVLIVPSPSMYPHLTDRIGNWRELCPYLPLLQAIGTKMVDKALPASPGAAGTDIPAPDRRTTWLINI